MGSLSIGSILILVLLLILYFAPAIVARRRLHTSRTGIVVLNLLLGWTLIGWIVALVWAYSGPDNRDAPSADATRRCPYCAEQILAAAIVCKHCSRDVAAGTRGAP